MERAVGFSAEKFKTTFESVSRQSVPASNILIFHYTSFENGRMAMRSGIAALDKFDGIPFTLRQPHQTGSAERSVFNSSNNQENIKFPNEVLLVVCLPRNLLIPLKGFEKEEYLCVLPSRILISMRSMKPSGVVTLQPWFEGFVLLPPGCILRSYQLIDENNNISSSSRKSDQSSSSVGNIHDSLMKDSPIIERKVKPQLVQFVDDYLNKMKEVREIARKNNLIPLYHYTSPNIISLIIEGGMRMSTQGQGDGGVYFSTRGPLSYGLGTLNYEENIIKDCFGVGRVDEYKGKGKLDAVIIYGCEGDLLQQAPGGRDNAKMIPKPFFKDLMLPQIDGNYFLGPD